MKTIHVITLGKLRDKNYLSIEHEYLKRIKSFKVKYHELKTHEENLELEGAEVLKKVQDISKEGSPLLFLLAEKGKEFDSSQFSDWLFKKLENHHGPLCFIFGGAAGHGNNLMEQKHEKISLSLMTFPHQMARVIFDEQLYRADTIYLNHPYHK
ncbi:23S rRNA (pseudouridine(1915)-N(3))-methyltransferase RlmH [Bacteriovoracaceae bacterium]|nr:23S rRNA (pseudouridine(1915)-N(3))-methyltransferase RlmH [Bacteriovoracaceae bacterium]